MKLWIMRHGEAEPLRGDNDDVRGLTVNGQRQARDSARWLLEQAPGPLRIVTSPYRRARQTAECVADIVKPLTVEQLDLLHPGGDPRHVSAWLGRQSDAELLLVSHMPLVGALTDWLCEGVLGGLPYGVAQLRLLELELAGPAQARRRAGFAPD